MMVGKMTVFSIFVENLYFKFEHSEEGRAL